MTQADNLYKRSRDEWEDCNHRQEWEHDLINRKTTWSLTGQTILFAAYGLTLRSDYFDKSGDFRKVVACSGLLVAIITLIGVLAIINSKFLSWRMYRKFYPRNRNSHKRNRFWPFKREQNAPPSSEEPELPGPLKGNSLQWGVNTFNTLVTLLPDVALPVIFAVAWLRLL
jgi:hypothetical protein